MTRLLKLCEFEIVVLQKTGKRRACEGDGNSAMPKGRESSPSLDPSDGLIGDSSSHIRPVTGVFGSGCLRESWNTSPPRRKSPILTGVARCDRHQFPRRSSIA